MFYPLIKKCLFLLKPETAHTVTMKALKLAHLTHLSALYKKTFHHPTVLMGLNFPNTIGMAAGLDKNGEYIDALSDFGFGFIEIGTVTPKPQHGNPKPRLFRLVEEEAIINRMGFNSKGMHYVASQLKKTNYKGILGVNIGRNKDTPNTHAIDDYIQCFRTLAPFASYITVNISSPNTPNLRLLQEKEFLPELLDTLKHEQQYFKFISKRYVPLVVKVAPDLLPDDIKIMSAIFLENKIDGVIACNTSITRTGVAHSPLKSEAGGLSGKPIKDMTTDIIKQFYACLEDTIPIIGCGGIHDKQSADEKRAAGAALLQVYTGFIYQGMKVIEEIV